MDWVNGFFLPLAEVVVIGGIIGYIGFFILRGLRRNWTQQTKWFFKYSIFRKKMPETTVLWCINAIENHIGYYDAKKLLYVHNGENMDYVYETLWIYDKIIMDLYKERKKNKIVGNMELGRGYQNIKNTQLPETKK